MQIEELRHRAATYASTLSPPPDLDGARDQLRSEVATFLELLPEPPVYRRRDDPAKAQALHLLQQGERLLGRLFRLESERLLAWRAALEASLESQCLVSEGRLEAAEDAWFRARELERVAAKDRRVWSRTDEVQPAVFDGESGASRFDPRPEPSLQGKLLCPHCRAVGDFSFSLRHAMHHFACRTCRKPFAAYVGELRALEQKKEGNRVQYVARVEEVSGELTRVDFEDSSGATFTAARRDLIAFLYAPRPVLRGVLNLSSGRALWLQGGGFCFLASAVFDEGAPELQTFRAFRDRVLLPRRWGRRAVHTYYCAGPMLARWARRSPSFTALSRRSLTAIHRVMQARGRA